MISVILCTHDPRSDFLERTLEGLSRQVFPDEKWELVIIDNASQEPVAAQSPVRAYGRPMRIVNEPNLGLTNARSKGIQEASGDLIVMVDDDNVLDPNYLAEADRLFTDARIGAAGGICEGEFEVEPPQWAQGYIDLFGIRNFGDRPIQALVYDRGGPWEPIGAGMAVRREIALHYLELIHRDPRRRKLDRVGGSLASCGDTDLARCAFDLGYFCAYQPTLKLTHLIPKSRVTFDYVSQLVDSLKYSGITLDRMRGWTSHLPLWKAGLRLIVAPLQSMHPQPRVWRLKWAALRSEVRARRAILS